MRYCWKRGLSTRDAAGKINDAEGEGTASQPTVSRWFKCFDFGDMNLEDQTLSGHPSVLNEENFRAA